jgi:hypothetical protein
LVFAFIIPKNSGFIKRIPKEFIILFPIHNLKMNLNFILTPRFFYDKMDLAKITRRLEIERLTGMQKRRAKRVPPFKARPARKRRAGLFRRDGGLSRVRRGKKLFRAC